MTESQATPLADGAAAAGPTDAIETEASLGSSDHGRAANGALRALSRAARSFLIYDTNNEAIRNFLAEFREAALAAVAMGSMELEVRPFELVLSGEVVYLERDRDRSLAFRMYRDGVRRLTIENGVEWPELLRLLEILSIRYTGVRQHEDDIVTLLWKAGFKNIDVTAVEGFVPDEEEEAGVDPAHASPRARRNVHGANLEVPRDWDLPCPPHDYTEGLAFRAIADVKLQALRAEMSSHQLPDYAIRLVTEMVALVREPTDPTSLSEISHLFEEVRDFLLAEGQLGRLLDLARELQALHEVDAERAQIELARFADARALRRILHSASRASDAAPQELIELLELVPGDHLRDLIEVLGVERSRAARRITRQLIARYVATRMEFLHELVETAAPELAADIIRSLSDAAPEMARRLLSQLVPRPEPEIQSEVFHILKGVEPGEIEPRHLTVMLVAPSYKVRRRVIALLVAAEDSEAFEPLVSHLDSPSCGALEDGEPAAIGIALAKIDPMRAADLLADWVRPRNWFDRVKGVASPKHRQWAGVAGLGDIEGKHAEDCIRWLSKRAGAELADHCEKTLYRRRQEGRNRRERVLVTGEVKMIRGVLWHPGQLTLTERTLRFVPTGTFDRLAGAAEVSVPLRQIESAELIKDGKILLVKAYRSFRFTGGEPIAQAHSQIGQMMARRGSA